MFSNGNQSLTATNPNKPNNDKMSFLWYLIKVNRRTVFIIVLNK